MNHIFAFFLSHLLKTSCITFGHMGYQKKLSWIESESIRSEFYPELLQTSKILTFKTSKSIVYSPKKGYIHGARKLIFSRLLIKLLNILGNKTIKEDT